MEHTLATIAFLLMSFTHRAERKLSKTDGEKKIDFCFNADRSVEVSWPTANFTNE